MYNLTINESPPRSPSRRHRHPSVNHFHDRRRRRLAHARAHGQCDMIFFIKRSAARSLVVSTEFNVNIRGTAIATAIVTFRDHSSWIFRRQTSHRLPYATIINSFCFFSLVFRLDVSSVSHPLRSQSFRSL